MQSIVKVYKYLISSLESFSDSDILKRADFVQFSMSSTIFEQ